MMLVTSQVKQFYSELKSHNVTHEPTYIQHMYGGNNNSEKEILKKKKGSRENRTTGVKDGARILIVKQPEWE